MSRGRKKQENPEAKGRILAAAEQLFAASGLAGTGTEDIARAARVNKAMLFYYFKNKQQLHRAVLQQLFREFGESVYAQRRKTDEPRRQLLCLAAGYFDFLAAHPNYPRLVQREAMEGSSNFKWIVGEYFAPFFKEVVRIISSGMAKREIRRLDPENTALSIFGMTMSYFAAAPIFSRMTGRNLLAPAAVVRRRAALLDWIEHGLIPEGEMSR